LAYTIYAHPQVVCSCTTHYLTQDLLYIPEIEWNPGRSSQATLLRAEARVVPFHRRDKELSDLQDWCRDSSPVRVRLYTGPGGMGKTRLALEAALKMQDAGWWAGFVTSEAIRSPEETWKALARPEGKLLLIVDHAETNRPFLVPVLREMHRFEQGPVRLILLARAALDWWEQLKSEREGVGELLSGPATARYSLQPLADSVEARAASYAIAAKAFSERLQVPPTGRPDDLGAEYFQRALLLHMRALIDLEGQERAKGEDGILDRILARERRYWETLAVRRDCSRDRPWHRPRHGRDHPGRRRSRRGRGARSPPRSQVLRRPAGGRADRSGPAASRVLPRRALDRAPPARLAGRALGAARARTGAG